MDSKGMSLVGFMDEAIAVKHLTEGCIPTNADLAAIKALWVSAQAKLGPPASNAGSPKIEDIPASHAAYITALTQIPWVLQAMTVAWPGSTFKLVEAAPLIAYQPTYDLDHSAHRCSSFSQPPTLDQLLAVCLPSTFDQEKVQVNPGGQSMLVRSRSANFRITGHGVFTLPDGSHVVGAQLGISIPLVHVARVKGRCYLHNGYHRVGGALAAGAEQIPCIFRDAPDLESIGIREDGSTFNQALVMSANPPTVGHFDESKALEVVLRGHSRVIHVGWGEYISLDV